MKTTKTQLQIIDSCESTNSALDPAAPHGTALMARCQSAGRGQRGNSWESEPGKNITLSLMLRPEGLPAARQFELSEAVSLGVADLLDNLGIDDVCVKWPNDIYVADRKIAGILIENTVSGPLIARAVAGIGLNVNQAEFRSDAPNPVSLRQLTGTDHPVDQLAADLLDCIMNRLGRDNHHDYCCRLWRGQGEWPWEVAATGETFTAAIDDVLPDGRLCLSGREPFAFKEVRPVGFKN